ncbi:hypothetical protein HDA32_001769 [Spinactinospora alkalitolerans]|uniref:Uncharacterized protein n=1 Tax=Spinactinospora alkalitolerans TaxID=687207 RepID=A0A852TRL3_9ACTN|nr:hypothetical protein [Spinactinospora alkalitolerans]NYE46649.1 hypothetical protein [Spinactinospora alkalitolerans]
MPPTAVPGDAFPALADAGLLPPDAEVPGTHPVRARAFGHPALPRPTVRIVADAVAPAEDAALAHLGFGLRHVSEPVARGRASAPLRYPYWALVHDPDGAVAALAATRRLEAAARLAGTKPGRAFSAYEDIAETLPPLQAPPMWDEAARSFIEAERHYYAQRCFSRARRAERVLPEPPDTEAVRAAFLEFSEVGAVGVKEVKEHVADLGARFGAERAHAELRELALLRSRAGLPPWADLVDQIGAWAREAGLDPAAEQSGLLAELLSLSAVSQAENGFWDRNRTGIARLAERDPRMRPLLRTMVSGSGMRAAPRSWVPLLLESGAVADLAATAAPGETAAWLEHAMAAATRRAWTGQPDNDAYALVAPLAARLRADGVPVKAWGVSLRSGRTLRPGLLDTLLGEGVPFDDGGATVDADAFMGKWDTPPPHGPHGYAPLMADSRYAPLVRDLVDRYTEAGRVHVLWRLPLLRPLVTARLDVLADDLVHGGLHRARTALEVLEHVDRRFWDAVPGQVARIREADADAVLARTLRRGIVDELEQPDRSRVVKVKRSGPGMLMTMSSAAFAHVRRLRAATSGAADGTDPADPADAADGAAAAPGLHADLAALDGARRTRFEAVSEVRFGWFRAGDGDNGDLVEISDDDPPGRWCPPGAPPADIVGPEAYGPRSPWHERRVRIVDRSGDHEEVLWSLPAESAVWTAVHGVADGTSEPLRPELAAHLTPRDPEASARLRAVTDGQARALVRAAAAEIGGIHRFQSRSMPLPATRAEVDRLLPGAHDALAKGVAGLAREAALFQRALRRLHERPV